MKKESLIIISLFFVLGLCCKSFRNIDPIKPKSKIEDHQFHKNAFEWIYYSGLLETINGRKFAMMYSLFQLKNPVNSQLKYPGILVLIDLENKKYYHEIDYGLKIQDVQIGVDSIKSASLKYIILDDKRFHIEANFEKAVVPISASLEMNSQRPPIFHGKDGLIKMGDGNTSAYYSYSSMIPKGEIVINDSTFNINKGRVWMDHQWGNWEYEALRWDWFSVRMDDESAFMLFSFRDKKGSSRFEQWTYRNAEGKIQHGNDCILKSQNTYRNKKVQADFPIDWIITVPELSAQFKITPIIEDQTVTPLKLWEGYCTTEASIAGKNVNAHAFVEMTLY